MSTKLRVAMLQMNVSGIGLADHLKKGEAFCRRAKEGGADIALFPEMWNIGYSFFDPGVPQTRVDWEALAIGLDDPFVLHHRALARELDMAIAVTFLEKTAAGPRNTVSLIDRHGEIRLTYAKVHTCDFSQEGACVPGDDFHVCTLDTAQGPVQVGAMICYDREFPESARILMLKGAELILIPNCCGIDEPRVAQLLTRAYENALGLAMTNYAEPNANGNSVAFDGAASWMEKDGGMLLVRAGGDEGVPMADFDLERLRHHRIHTIWGNTFRRPSRYGLLTSMDVKGPFHRDAARR